MSAPLVKICGLTRLEDALASIELGADFLGFNFYPASPRYLEPERARELFAEIPPNIPKVGIFVNEELRDVLDLAIDLGLDYLQFHGDEAPEALSELGRPWFKALRLKSPEDLALVPQYHCEWILADAFAGDQYGGSGNLGSWELARRIPAYGKKLILAGGLNPQNVAAAVQATSPFMVDVASGVEIRPGIKDAGKIEALIRAVKKETI